MNSINIQVGRAIEAARRQADKKPGEVARAMHVPAQAYLSWESGRKLPTVDELVNLAMLFDVTPNDLIGWEG